MLKTNDGPLTAVYFATGLGISPARTGGGKYVPDDIRFHIDAEKYIPLTMKGMIFFSDHLCHTHKAIEAVLLVPEDFA